METGQRFTLPPEKPEEPTKQDFPSETAFEQKRGNHTKLTNGSLVDDLNLKKKSANSPTRVLSTDNNFPFLFYHSFLTKQEILFWRMWHAFFDEGATETKHAAVAKEFEYPYASPLDELRAVDKALWVFFYLRILLQDMNI